MVRPQKDRMVAFNPEISYFKPRGIPMIDLEEVCLTVDQREAIRLSDLMGMSHEDAGRWIGLPRHLRDLCRHGVRTGPQRGKRIVSGQVAV